MAQGINLIAQERLAGADVARLAPVGFNPTATHYLILEAVSWTAALRRRLMAVVPRAYAPGLAKAERAPRGRGAVPYLPRDMVAASDNDGHDWRELARPWRMGPGGVAFAARAMEKLSIREIVSNICDKLKRAAVALEADADVGRIAAMEAAALALCPEAEARAGAAVPEDAPKDTAAAAKAGGAPGARPMGPPAEEPESGAETEADTDPPSRPPD
jgi:hypothetical protein